MSNVFTLDSLREEIEKEFAPCKAVLSDGTEITLRSIIRLNGKRRKQVVDLVDKFQVAIAKGDDMTAEDLDVIVDSVGKILELVAASNGKRLVQELDGDLQLSVSVLSQWIEATQVGEAESSPESSTDTASS